MCKLLFVQNVQESRVYMANHHHISSKCCFRNLDLVPLFLFMLFFMIGYATRMGS